jgi:hypothetical protein
MTFADFNSQLNQTINNLRGQALNDILIQTGKEIEGLQKRRIFNNGDAADGSKIGEATNGYSTTSPKFATEDSFVVKGAFRPQARKRAVNKGSSPGGAGTTRTSIDLDRGYRELRELQGRQTAYVDLSYSGSLQASLQLGTVGDAVVLGFSNGEESAKGAAMERKFRKDIWGLSAQEIEDGTDVFTILLGQIILV